jgi:hypothetical protein
LRKTDRKRGGGRWWDGEDEEMSKVAREEK